MLALPPKHRKRRLPLLVALVLVTIVVLYRRNTDRLYLKWAAHVEALPGKLPANRTLGFGAVVVVSKDGSDRRHALLQAANVTDIDLTIPHQPVWTEGDVVTFQNGQKDYVQRGSILAWLGHRNALQWFLDSGLESVLILEDDVDWDIRLRSKQIPLAASAARSMLPPAKPNSPFTAGRGNHTHYWGDTSAWDLLYLGHCGDYFNEVTYDGLVPPKGGFTWDDTPHTIYNDPSLPDMSDLHPYTQKLFAELKVEAHQRAFHRSRFPLCSFGYAVTRPAAERLLYSLALPQFRPKGPRAYDVALLHACTHGSKAPSPPPRRIIPYGDNGPPATGLRCWTVNSELFHHMPGESQIASLGQQLGEDTGIPPVDLAGQLQIIMRQETNNIGCGFWGGEFAFDDKDSARLKYLQEEVGRKGKCLKDGHTFEANETKS